MGEIADNCQGVKLVLVALKCDLRESAADGEEENSAEKDSNFIQYPEGLAVAEKIKVNTISLEMIVEITCLLTQI